MKHAEGSNAIFAQALEGIKFPATRDQLVEQAKQNGADKHVIEVLKNMPNDDKYNTMPDVFINTQEGKDKVESSGASGKSSTHRT